MTFRLETYGAFTVEEFATNVWRCYRTDFGPGALLVAGSHAGCVRGAKDRGQRHARALAWRVARATAGVPSVVPAPPQKLRKLGCWNPDTDPKTPAQIAAVEQALARQRKMNSRPVLAGRRTRSKPTAPKTPRPPVIIATGKSWRVSVACPYAACAAQIGEPCRTKAGSPVKYIHGVRWELCAPDSER